MDEEKLTKKEKVRRILSLIIICVGIWILCSVLISFLFWQLKLKDTAKETVYSDEFGLYYVKDDAYVYIEKVYNENKEVIELVLNDGSSTTLYCLDEKESYCIKPEDTSYVSLKSMLPELPIAAIMIILSFIIYPKVAKMNFKDIGKLGK